MRADLKADLKPVPRLDEIACDPALASGLPADVRQALTACAIGALNALYAASLADGATGQAERSEGDRLLDVKEAAARLGMAEATLYRRSKTNSAIRACIVDNGTKKLLFSSDKIEAFLRRRTGR